MEKEIFKLIFITVIFVIFGFSIGYFVGAKKIFSKYSLNLPKNIEYYILLGIISVLIFIILSR